MDPVLKRYRLSKRPNRRVEVPFLEEEVKAVVFSMDKDKSSGPDGFSMLFFQECWEILKRDLMEVFEEFYERGIISKGMNATFIVLIPKKEEASSFLDFRPISLVRSLYKIIAKVLSIRLCGVMDKVISNLQEAFVKRRQIMDGILIANELLDGQKRRKEPGLVCKWRRRMIEWIETFFNGFLRRKVLGRDGLDGSRGAWITLIFLL